MKIAMSNDTSEIEEINGATLFLENGDQFRGQLFGAIRSVTGELVFQTGMVGYVESLTDPSYANQLLTLTYPLIGNYGVADETTVDVHGLPRETGFESRRVWPAALVVSSICPDEEHSHWRAKQSLSAWLRKNNVPGLAGIDVRRLTKIIREHGALKAKLIIDADDVNSLNFVDINASNLVALVSRTEPKLFGISGSGPKILAVDCGMKTNQIRCFLRRNASVFVVPHNFPFDEHIQNYDGLFLSNGPGDPAQCEHIVNRLIKVMRSRLQRTPIFGICLGHQLLARAAGASTKKLPYGNRGHNQPCTHTDTGRCFITSQNHGFAVDAETLPDEWVELFVNENDKTNEGIIHRVLPFFGIQFHPEHMAGPADMEWLFDVFLTTVEKTMRGELTSVREAIKQKLNFASSYRISESSSRPHKVLILGSGGLSIGQAGEFDYSGAQAIKAMKELGLTTVLVNPNVATAQTSKGFADRTFFLPVTLEYVTEVIKKERPTGLLCTFGGQTGLNCAIALHKQGVLEKYDVQVLGTPIDAIMKTEDRDLFKQEIFSIGERVSECKSAKSLEEAEKVAADIGYPVLVRAEFALGGLGSGFANNVAELRAIAKQAFAHSPQLLIDKSCKGWKEIEYEVVRDAYDNCITVCNMENVDPLGIHTGESVVVAPSQTLTDEEYQMLRDTALKVIRHFGIIGECNIQYALHPNSLDYFIIEVNARLSRSSALASKATGYPLAYIAAKLALGKSLPSLKNAVTGGRTTACFEPSLDYCVVKVPRWDMSKFARASTQIGSSMKSVGESMAIGRTFEEALQKALRMISDQYEGFSPFAFKRGPIVDAKDLSIPTDKRMFALAKAFYDGSIIVDDSNMSNDNTMAVNVDVVHRLTGIDRWFLYRMRAITDTYKQLEQFTIATLPASLLRHVKQMGFSDAQVARQVKSAEAKVCELRKANGIVAFVKQIDTVAAEWPATTNYLYMTYNGAEHDVPFKQRNSKAVIVLGSGVYRIGSSVEFDACCVGCVDELKRLGHQRIMINCNPETVSTDYDTCDRLYFEEISLESVSNVYEVEHPAGLILAFGGQAANNIALSLQGAKLDVPMNVFGTKPEYIDEAEDRFKFSRALDELRIAQPQWKNATSVEEANAFCDAVGYPCLIRPSYVLSGAAMNVAHNSTDLTNFLHEAVVVAKKKPVVVSKFITNAKEIDVDVVALHGRVLVAAISEHVENAGIHSGDATLVLPAVDLNAETEKEIKKIVAKIAAHFNVSGPFNLQLIAKDNELFVIECNLRVSRSFPFVSKTYDFDFVAAATRAMMFTGADTNKLETQIKAEFPGRSKKIGVKVSQFSFSRLAGADVIMGVEMLSTGEVACFGKTRWEAYLKGLLSTGFTIPQRKIFVSFGGVTNKNEMFDSMKTLIDLGFELFGSKGTADFYSQNGIVIRTVEWPFEEDDGDYRSTPKIAAALLTVTDLMAQKFVDLIINLPIRGSGAYRVSNCRTHGYKTRRMAIDNGIPLITDVKCAKLFITALRELSRCKLLQPAINTKYDCLSTEQLVQLPGLIDIHVHMREPGGNHKETWASGTRAAIAGGITMVLAMPNTRPPLIDDESYNIVENVASKGAYCDYALFLGATPENVQFGAKIGENCAGLKMYLNETFAKIGLRFMDPRWKDHFKKFPANRPIVFHAEQETLAAVLFAAHIAKRAVHICHVSTAEEIGIIREAKQNEMAVTCEVCPHHLFLTEDLVKANFPDAGFFEVRPRLSKSYSDCEALWANIDFIDCFATDHAPHTKEEKMSEKAPPGFPGVQYMLPLLLTAVSEGRLTKEQLVDRLYHNPMKIFNLPKQPNTYVEVDMNREWIIPDDGGESEAKWTPYKGRTVRGQIRTVVIRGEEVVVDGQIVGKPGYGENVRLHYSLNQKSEADMDLDAGSIRNDTLENEFSNQENISRLSSISPSRSLGQEDNVFFGQNVISVSMFTDKEMLKVVLKRSEKFHKAISTRQHGFEDLLKRYSAALVFYEPSTRTIHSFENAMYRLGGKCSILNPQYSSIQKGESLEDTIQMMASYCDVIVLRHPEVDACRRAAEVSRKPIINAGDGTGEHPTQALLDLYTIQEKFGTINNITIAMVGDLKNGRTVHSLAKILCLYRDITLHYVSPTEDLQMPESIRNYVSEKSTFVQKTFTDFVEGIRGVDVIYMTRIQKERFNSQEEYDRVKGSFVLTPKILKEVSTEDNYVFVSERRQLLTPIIMHPLPRLDEINTEIDKDERAVYMQQAQYGLYVRMALLSLVLGENC